MEVFILNGSLYNNKVVINSLRALLARTIYIVFYCMTASNILRVNTFSVINEYTKITKPAYSFVYAK